MLFAAASLTFQASQQMQSQAHLNPEMRLQVQFEP